MAQFLPGGKVFGPPVSPSPAKHPLLIIPTGVAESTMRLLRSYLGIHGENHEGIVYWAGLEGNQAVTVLTVLAPEARTAPRMFSTSPTSNARAVSTARQLGLSILAQVHSHPGRHVGHSGTDDERAFMPYEGFYSLVVPNYAAGDFTPYSCGWYRFENGTFREKDGFWVKNQVCVVPSFVDLRGV